MMLSERKAKGIQQIAESCRVMLCMDDHPIQPNLASTLLIY